MSAGVVKIIGAGLAGCEAAWQAARLGAKVFLYEMKPQKKSPAHHTDGFCELVCSNSLRSNQLNNAVGLLKEELRLMGSLIMEAAINKLPEVKHATVSFMMARLVIEADDDAFPEVIDKAEKCIKGVNR
jgi:tRNA:m(5)U-54 methyltransferase